MDRRIKTSWIREREENGVTLESRDGIFRIEWPGDSITIGTGRVAALTAFQVAVMRQAAKRTVTITVKCGVAEVTSNPEGVDVTIEDLDGDEELPESYECSEPGCTVTVYREDPFYSSPCGTFCTAHFREHAKTCGVCGDEFPELLDDQDGQEEPASDRQDCLTPAGMEYARQVARASDRGTAKAIIAEMEDTLHYNRGIGTGAVHHRTP
jgi:hypothetical protein